MSDKVAETAEKKSLQAQMDELNALVEKLEDPELPLETALKLYEAGMELARTAQLALDEAEQRVAIINEQGDAEPFSP